MSSLGKLDLFLAHKLHFFRAQFGWPLKKLAEELGISLQQVQRYEQGVNKIPASVLFELSKIFKTDIQVFFEGYDESGVPKSTHDFSILLVEDNAHDEFLFRKALTEVPRKIELYVLKDGQEALNFFQEQTPPFMPNIIFMDLHLPHMTGFELLQNVKRRPQWRDIPVIMLTTSTSEDDVLKAYSLQSSGFLRKSFQFEEFKNQLCQSILYWMETVKLPTHATPHEPSEIK